MGVGGDSGLRDQTLQYNRKSLRLHHSYQESVGTTASVHNPEKTDSRTRRLVLVYLIAYSAVGTKSFAKNPCYLMSHRGDVRLENGHVELQQWDWVSAVSMDALLVATAL